jgi:hypothetical protein
MNGPAATAPGATALDTDAPPAWPTAAGPAPQPSSSWTEVPLGRSVPKVLAAIVAAAVLADLSVQTRAGGAAATAMVIVLCASLARHGWVVRRGGRLLLGAAAGLSVFLVLRVSPWLVALDLGVIAALMALACSAERDGRFGDSRFATIGRRLASTAVSMLTAVDPLVRATGKVVPGTGSGRRRTLRSVLRGLLIAVPVVAVIGLNLASADAVFASLFEVDLHLDRWVGHVVVVVIAACVAAGWFVQASRPPVTHPTRSMSVGAVEASVVMVSLTALYAVFAWTQVLVARRGPDYVARTTGLTYAEYARSGFFQLLWVAGATAVVLLVVRSVVVPTSRAAARWIAATGAVAASLTLVVVHAAIVRLDLYESAFGLTLLRYGATAFAWWLGAVFVVIAAWFVLGLRSRRDWLPTALGLVTLAMVVGINVADPEATVMRHNVERARAGASFDVQYALRLSDDAVPALANSVDELPPETTEALRRDLCPVTDGGPARWTFSEAAADDARRRLCS